MGREFSESMPPQEEYHKKCSEVAYKIHKRRELEALYGEDEGTRNYYKELTTRDPRHKQELDYQLAEQWIQSPYCENILTSFEQRFQDLETRKKNAEEQKEEII